jgi:hypothetical protein
LLDAFGRARAATVAALAASLVVLTIGPAVVHAHDIEGHGRFVEALGEVESGGNYYARNATSGAYGKYQIMPPNWPGWAALYVGDANAPWTPANQDAVARGKTHDLHHWLGAWDIVAHWWLTGSGSTDRSTWSTYSKNYVARVMAVYAALEDAPAVTIVGHQDRGVLYSGAWTEVYHEGYRSGAAMSSEEAGASVVLTFAGTKATWWGPVGPTRGKAKVYVDGAYVKTVDTHAATFQPRVELFSKEWSAIGRHYVVIVVEATGGRPTVAVDSFDVRDMTLHLRHEVWPYVEVKVKG